MAAIQLTNGFEMNVEIIRGIVPTDTLLIHGNLASNNWWQPSIEHWLKLADTNKEVRQPGRLILGEWRGCGSSAPPRSRAELHPANLADDYLKLLLELDVKKANIVGHSTGGLIALYALLKAPALFERVVLLDSIGAKGARFAQEKLQALTQMSQDRSFCAAVLGATIYENDFTSPLFEILVNDAFNCAKEVWHGIPEVLHQINLTAQLPQIQHPTLVLHGEFDQLIPKQDSLFLADNLGHARFHEFKGQGHSTNVENPSLFVTTVNAFLFDTI